MRSCWSDLLQVLVVCVLLQALGCQQQESSTQTKDTQAVQAPTIRMRSLRSVTGQRVQYDDQLEFYEFTPSTGGFETIGTSTSGFNGFLSLSSYAVAGGRLHFAEIAAYEFALVFVPSDARPYPLHSDSNEWHLPVLNVARGRCPVFVPGHNRRLVPLVDAHGDAVVLAQGDAIYVSDPLSIYGPSSHPYVWTVLADDEPKVVWVSQHCLDTMVDYTTLVFDVIDRSKAIATEHAENIQRYKDASANLRDLIPTRLRVSDPVGDAIHASITAQTPPTLEELRQTILQIKEVVARQYAYPWEDVYPTAPITLAELRLLHSANNVAPSAPSRIEGLYANETQVFVRSNVDPHAFENQAAHGTYAPLMAALWPVAASGWLAARNRLADALGQDLVGKQVDASVQHRFQGDHAYDFAQCGEPTNCVAPRPETLFLTRQVPFVPSQPVPLSLLASIMVDLVNVFNIEFFLANGSSAWSHYVINTGVASEVQTLSGLAEIGHIHPTGIRALSASFILPATPDGDRVYFDNKGELYALEHVGQGSDLCAQFLTGDFASFIFLSNGMAVRHELPVSAEQQLVTLPIRTTYGHVTVSVDRHDPCWKAAYAGFPQAPLAPEPLQ
jgi:hypothetical protein